MMMNTIGEMMHNITQGLKVIGVELALIVAGVFGGIVNISKDKDMTVWQKGIAILSGGATANYITPVFISFLNISDNTKFGIAFIVGYMGLKSIEMLIVRIKKGLDQAKAE
jgi:hypothetical protein